jgi:hypothetical protein
LFRQFGLQIADAAIPEVGVSLQVKSPKGGVCRRRSTGLGKLFGFRSRPGSL